MIVAVVLIFVRPGASQGDDSGTAPESTRNTATATPEATTIPTEPVAVDGDPCAPEKLTVEAVTDKTSYNAGEQPQLSVTITNTGKNICVLNAGTKAQAFTITSGTEVYWTSTDCQVDAIDAEVSLDPEHPDQLERADRLGSHPVDTRHVRGAARGGAGGWRVVSPDGLGRRFRVGRDEAVPALLSAASDVPGPT